MKHFRNLAYGLLVLVTFCGISKLIIVIGGVEALYTVLIVSGFGVACYGIGVMISEYIDEE